VLPAFSARSSENARRQLEQLGVEVRTSAMVTGVDPWGVEIGRERVAAATTVWAAGVAASPLARSLGAPLDRVGRVRVNPDLTIPEHPEIFVVGDLVSLEQPSGQPLPGVAPAAMQAGEHAARSIMRRLRGESVEPFHYFDKGNLATIGRSKAVADLGRIHLRGFVAWAAWLVVHIFFLIGFRNRILVVFGWAWAYLTYERGARLITGDPKRNGVLPDRLADHARQRP
jgi:NADH dehydrogenase